MHARLPLPSPSGRDTFAAILSAAAVATAVALVLLAHDLGARAAHMALHIALMNVLAPLAAVLFAARLPGRLATDKVLWSSATLQLALLWAWHVPVVERWAHASHGLHLAAYTALFLAAFVFWAAVIRGAGHARWQAVAALLLTGKLTCLLSALLVFAPRTLYGGADAVAPLDDQQLAGLLMITACPLSYLVAAVVIAMRLINDAARRDHPGAAAAG